MVKILHLNTFDFGGAANAAIRLHEALLASGADSRILFLKKTRDNIANSDAFLADPRQTVTFTRKQDSEKLQSLKHQCGIDGPIPCEVLSFPETNFTELAKHPLIHWADIIHLHWVSRFVDMGTFFGELKKPIVWTFHDENPFSGIFHYYGDFQKNSWTQTLCEEIENFKRQIFNDNEIHVICPSHWLLQRFHQKGGFSPASSSMIRNVFISNSHTIKKNLAKDALQLPQSKPALLFMSADLHNERKRFSLFCDLANQFRSSDLLFYCAGNANGRPVPDNIEHLGELSNSKVISLVLSAMDATVVCSSEDNLPNVLLESFQHGLPVIGTPCGGIPEVITAQTGVCALANSLEALSNAVEQFVSNLHHFNPAQIISYAQSEFSPDKQAARHIELYQRILDNCSHSA